MSDWATICSGSTKSERFFRCACIAPTITETFTT